MIPIDRAKKGVKLLRSARGDSVTRTFDETSPSPFHLGSHHNTRGGTAGPCDARPRLDTEYAHTGYVRCTRRRHCRNIIVISTVDSLVADLAFCRLGANASTQRFDIRHVPSETALVTRYRRPVRYLMSTHAVSHLGETEKTETCLPTSGPHA